MTEAGWYRGEGDPPGTQRYWNGNAWVGDPVYEVTTTAVPPPPTAGGNAYAYPVVARSTFPTYLKVVAIVVTALKAIPLALATVLVVWLALLANSTDDDFRDFGFGLDDLLGAAIAFLFVIIAIGGVLLGFQFAGALKERPIMLFVPALIMTLFDVLFLVGAWTSYREAQNSSFSDDSPAGVVLMAAVAAAQGFVAVQAIRANSN